MLQINHHKNEKRTNTHTQCMDESLFKRHTQSLAHLHCNYTSWTLCKRTVCTSISFTTMGNKFLLTTKVKTNKEFCEIINTYSRSNFILKSLVIIKTNLSLNGDFERGFELDLHDLAGKDLDITIVPQSTTIFFYSLIGIWFGFCYVIKISKQAEHTVSCGVSNVHNNEITQSFLD